MHLDGTAVFFSRFRRGVQMLGSVVPQKKSLGAKCALHTVIAFDTGFRILSLVAHSFFKLLFKGNL